MKGVVRVEKIWLAYIKVSIVKKYVENKCREVTTEGKM